MYLISTMVIRICVGFTWGDDDDDAKGLSPRIAGS